MLIIFLQCLSQMPALIPVYENGYRKNKKLPMPCGLSQGECGVVGKKSAGDVLLSGNGHIFKSWIVNYAAQQPPIQRIKQIFTKNL
jgi:hypothetical protein